MAFERAFFYIGVVDHPLLAVFSSYHLLNISTRRSNSPTTLRGTTTAKRARWPN
jgi:hypothetical protein